MLAAVALAVLFSQGCRRVPAPGTAPGEPKTAAAAVDPATLGGVSGVVSVSGNVPAPVKIDTSMDPACGLGGGDTFSEQFVGDKGRLGNVYVYVKSGAPKDVGTVGAGANAVLDQKGCVYTPHVIAVQQGGSVEFRNEDPTMHNIHTMPAVAGNQAVDISQGPRGKPQTVRFKQAEVMMPVRCNNHPWMNAFINVSATPWFAVTGPDGKFSFKGLPAGEYTLGALHEKLGEQVIHVTVKAQTDASADFSFAMK